MKAKCGSRLNEMYPELFGGTCQDCHDIAKLLNRYGIEKSRQHVHRFARSLHATQIAGLSLTEVTSMIHKAINAEERENDEPT